MGKLKGEATGELRDLTGDSALRDGAATAGLGAIKVRTGKRKKKSKLHQVSYNLARNKNLVLFLFLVFHRWSEVEPQTK